MELYEVASMAGQMLLVVVAWWWLTARVHDCFPTPRVSNARDGGGSSLWRWSA
jgi:hypothetical protein